jgi:hypothetical protein
MAVAIAYPEPDKGGRGKKALESSGFSQQRLSQARQVLNYSQEMARQVLNDTIKLDAALAKVVADQKNCNRR